MNCNKDKAMKLPSNAFPSLFFLILSNVFNGAFLPFVEFNIPLHSFFQSFFQVVCRIIIQ